MRCFQLFILAFLLLPISCTKKNGTSGNNTQEKTLSATGETSVRSMTPAQNFNSMELMVQNSTSGNARSYVRFDLSPIPAGVTIVEARVELYYCQCDGIDDIAAYPAAADWNPSSLTWNNQPGAANISQPLDVVNLNPDYMTNYGCGDVGGYVAESGGMASKRGWLVTDLVKGWFTGATANNGIVFKAYPEMDPPDPPGRVAAIFGNNEDSGLCPSKPPRLRVKYQ